MFNKILLMLLISTPTAFAEETEVTDVTETAKTFFNALYGSDFNTVRELLSPDIYFEDPTSPEGGLGVPQILKGKDAYLAFWEGVATQLEKDWEITNSYESAGHVVLFIDVKGTAPAETMGLEGNKIALETEGITVLHVKDGRIVRHSDFFDYSKALSSVRVIE